MAEASLQLYCPKSVGRTIIRKAIKRLNWQIDEDLNDKIMASTPSSLASWGEAIEISLSSSGSLTEVTVISTPKLQIFDWGKGDENIERLIEEIKSLC